MLIRWARCDMFSNCRSYNPKWLPATGHSRTCSRDKPRNRTQVGGAGEFWLVHSTRVIAQRPPPYSIITRESRVTPDPCSYQVLAPVSRLHLQPLASISKSNIDIAISPQLATDLALCRSPISWANLPLACYCLPRSSGTLIWLILYKYLVWYCSLFNIISMSGRIQCISIQYEDKSVYLRC